MFHQSIHIMNLSKTNFNYAANIFVQSEKYGMMNFLNLKYAHKKTKIRCKMS